MRSLKLQARALFSLAAVLILAACASGERTETPTVPVNTPIPATQAAAQSPLASEASSATDPATVESTAQAATSSPASTETSSPAASVTSLPDPAGYTWAEVVTGLNRPIGLGTPRDGSNRLFVLEQPGIIRVIQDGNLLPEPFMDITDRVGSQGSEQGLLGIDFHPTYAENGFFYVNYTDKQGDTVIARYGVAADDPNRGDPGSETVLLTVDQPYPNHNGGGVLFGPDGFLYLSLGDGGSAGDPQGNAQSLSTLLGKILRIDVSSGERYTIPAGNPFANQAGAQPEIWLYGLRNPWRFSFDRQTGDLFIADVGQNQYEEIDFLAAGSPGSGNFGWDFKEGSHTYEGSPPADAQLIPPVYEYDHSQGCSVTGGVVYRGSSLPEWNGVYIFADYCSGRLWGMIPSVSGQWAATMLMETGLSVTSFGQDEAGEVYLTHHQGAVYRLAKK